ncbi:MAG: hypothetical protein IPJ71_10400 [Bdellovibrionales bacterium]|nr:hypothetical protein [Bdellovibrionales bacterium]
MNTNTLFAIFFVVMPLMASSSSLDFPVLDKVDLELYPDRYIVYKGRTKEKLVKGDAKIVGVDSERNLYVDQVDFYQSGLSFEEFTGLSPKDKLRAVRNRLWFHPFRSSSDSRSMIVLIDVDTSIITSKRPNVVVFENGLFRASFELQSGSESSQDYIEKYYNDQATDQRNMDVLKRRDPEIHALFSQIDSIFPCPILVREKIH